jgi:hypothetical protein
MGGSADMRCECQKALARSREPSLTSFLFSLPFADNASWVVERSVEMGKPIVCFPLAVSRVGQLTNRSIASDGRFHQLPHRRPRFPFFLRSCRFGRAELWLLRPASRVELGTGEHQGVRRRSRQGYDLGREVRLSFCTPFFARRS